MSSNTVLKNSTLAEEDSKSFSDGKGHNPYGRTLKSSEMSFTAHIAKRKGTWEQSVFTWNDGSISYEPIIIYNEQGQVIRTVY